MMRQRAWSRILLVNDHPSQLGPLISALADEGHDVVGCLTMAEAISMAQRDPFAVALIDVQFPDEMGVDLVDQLTRMNGNVRFVLNAAFQALQIGTEDVHRERVTYFEKAESPSTLLTYVRRAYRAFAMHYVADLQHALARHTAELEEQRIRFQQLAEHIQEVFWIALPDHSQVLYVSPRYEAVWGRSCAGLLEHPHHLWEAVHPQDQECVLTRVAEGKAKGFQAEFRIIRPDQDLRWIRVRTLPMRNSSGEVVRMAGVAEDITKQKRAEETMVNTERQFRQSSRMEAIGTLAGGIAHDFNNILTAILGYTELALASVPKDSRTQRNLQEVLTAGHRAKHLVLQILAFSRQSGQVKKPTSMHGAIVEALELLHATIPSTIEIRHSLLTEASVLADPTQLHQIVINLCTNAEYAMRKTGGVLAITLDDFEVNEENVRSLAGLQVGPHVRLTVQDNGTGMSPEVLERMFDPFFTTKPIGEGSGMGLAVVHGIVTNHGGAILVESAGGHGTKIEVYLPAIPSSVDSGAGAYDPIPHGKETILFVDDEETIVRLGKELLSPLGYRVEVHTNSQEALNAFRQDPQRFDLVITDQTMPGLTGEALSRELLRLRPELPIILCTGFSHIMTAEKAKALGIQAYLMKPLAIRDLAPIVRHVLDKTLSPLA
ncbi:MAG: response regulator [Nitrospirota bacterium]|nr:response regulator [Nitrospirota bacterium]